MHAAVSLALLNGSYPYISNDPELCPSMDAEEKMLSSFLSRLLHSSIYVLYPYVAASSLLEAAA